MHRTERHGLRLYGLEAALIEASPRYFMNQATDARAALAMIRDASDLLGRLLDGGHSTIAGRLAGGFRNCGRDAIADEAIASMTRGRLRLCSFFKNGRPGNRADERPGGLDSLLS